jgi:rhodanese-related sulfurtransferase
VYPAHGAGSLCGKSIGSALATTIGEQRQVNYALQPMTEDEFVEIVTADQPEAPPYFTYDAILNTRERPTLESELERQLKPLELEEVLKRRGAGAQILDTRDPAEFARAHLEGSVNIGLGGEYATWAGTLLDHQRPVIVVAEPGREEEAAMRLGRIGFDIVEGYLDGGVSSLEERLDLLAGSERVLPNEAAPEVASTDPPVILDVRTTREWNASRIPGSVNIPLTQLEARMDEVPRDRRVLVYCAGGYRSSMAASLLQREGVEDVLDLSGGFVAWEGARLPTEAGTPLREAES